jgi:hypothetical protein
VSSTFWWYEQAGGSAAGPFTEDYIRRLLAEGTLPHDARIWSSRREPWPPPVAPQARERLGADGRAIGWLLLSVPFLLGWLLFGLALTLIAGGGPAPTDLRVHAWLLPAAGGALILAALGLVFHWWSAPRKLGAGAELAAGLRIAAALVAAAWLLPAAIVLRDAPVAIRTAQVVDDWSYLLSAGPDDHTLVVQGVIGPGFGQRLSQRLETLPDPARIIIESPGGLIDEALVAARAIEKRKAVVMVGGFCASACTIVLMGGSRRLAPLDGEIAFHATSPVVASTNAVANWLAGQAGERARAYLLSRGVPAADVDEARRRGARDIFAVADVTALEQGVLTGLYDDRGEIDRETLSARRPRSR